MEETQKEKQAVPEPIDIITLLHDVLRGVKQPGQPDRKSVV